MSEVHAPPRRVLLGDVIAAASRCFGLTKDALLSDQKPAALAYPRQIMFYVMSVVANRPRLSIEYYLGFDHTTILYAATKIDQRLGEPGHGELRKDVSRVHAEALNAAYRRERWYAKTRAEMRASGVVPPEEVPLVPSDTP